MMYDIMCGAISARLDDVIKNAKISVCYIKKKDRLEVKIKPIFFDREFITGYVFFTELIHTGSSGYQIAENVIKQYRRWVNNNFFKN